ncbi:MAG: OmpH family outer membrane protein [Flavobacteriaceae bacterium]
MVYVDNVAVFSGFNLAKDLNSIHQKELKLQKNKVDSIITILQADPESNPTEQQQRQFVFENNKLKEMGEYLQNEVSQQVWNRINDYIQLYGDQNNFKIILGTQGNGNIMYGDKEVDITNAFIEFANNKYEGEQ